VTVDGRVSAGNQLLRQNEFILEGCLRQIWISKVGHARRSPDWLYDRRFRNSDAGDCERTWSRAHPHAPSRRTRRATDHLRPVAYDAQLGAFSLDGLPLRLTALEWRVLSCLMLRKEHVVAGRDILERVYDGDAEVDSNSVEVIVARLRRKIGHKLIRTVRGLGYRLTAEPS
jgi:DNA-binding response OmpR family regulator